MASILRGIACVAGLLSATAWAAPISSEPAGISPVVPASWLIDNLDNSNLLVVDIRESALYKTSHIPGSLSIPFASDSLWARSASGDTLMMPPQNELFADFGKHGFTPEKNIVLVTSVEQMPVGIARATRVAATLQYAGFPTSQVGILDGGFQAWVRANGAITAQSTTIVPTEFTGAVDGSFIAEREYVKASVGKLQDGVALMDARSKADYTNGHIESALSLPLAELWKADGTYKSNEELLAVFKSRVGNAPVGVTEGEVIVYCWIGLMATGLHYTLNNVLGFQNVKLYDGSVEDWSKKYPLVRE
jgi:thiosulfate/3-mercaptopyruvate sulfurtransferase